MKTGIELIAQERQEQIVKHGRTVENDVLFNNYGDLMSAACGLLFTDEQLSPMDIVKATTLKNWNADLLDYMAAKPYKQRLIIAGAFIAAEIDRLQNTK